MADPSVFRQIGFALCSFTKVQLTFPDQLQIHDADISDSHFRDVVAERESAISRMDVLNFVTSLFVSVSIFFVIEEILHLDKAVHHSFDAISAL
jgi:hypothetical protein